MRAAGTSCGVPVMVLTMGLLFLPVAQSLGKEPDGEDLPAEGQAASRGLLSSLQERFKAARQRPFVETADEVLIERRQVQWRRYLNALLNTPEWLGLAVEHRTRWEGLDVPFRVGEVGDDRQWLFRTRARLGLNWRVYKFLVEFIDARAEGGGLGDFDSGSLEAKSDLQQVLVSATLHNVLGTGLRTDLHLGKLTLDFGRRRLIARNRFRNTSNAFTGMHWNLARENLWRVRAFFVTPVISEFKASSLFDVQDTLFWGLYYETNQVPWVRTNLYYFGLDDVSDDVPSDKRRQFSTFGLRLYKMPRLREFDYEVETVWQVGEKGAQDHFAHFQHVGVGYSFRAPWRPRLIAQYDYASGTASPTGNYSQTFDTLFGARRFEYTPTSLFGPFFRSNISSPGVRVLLRPLAAVGVTLKFRAWYLAQSRDAWAGSGLQDPTGASGNVLGQDLEVRVQWAPTSNLSFEAGYDHFFKGSYIENLAKVPGNPPATDTDYFYIQTDVTF